MTTLTASPESLALPADPSAMRHHRLDRPSWWRCLVDRLGGEARAWGTVTGYVHLGTVVTTYHVQLDDGAAVQAWPSSVERAQPAPGPPVLLCLPGGKAPS